MSNAAPAFSWSAFGRSFAGFLLAPPLTGMVVGSLFAIVYGSTQVAVEDVTTFIAAAALGAGFGFQVGAVLGVPMAFLAGWPVHLLLMQIRFTGIFVYGCFAGSLTVAAMAYAFSLRLEPSFSFTPAPLEAALTVAAIGWLAGAIFWFIRRPDLDAPSASQTP